VLFAFRGTTPERQHTFRLRGFAPDARYAVTSEDGGVAPRVVTGRELMQGGLVLALDEPGSSDLVYFRRTSTRTGTPGGSRATRLADLDRR
jgi:hypothetical protein